MSRSTSDPNAITATFEPSGKLFEERTTARFRPPIRSSSSMLRLRSTTRTRVVAIASCSAGPGNRRRRRRDPLRSRESRRAWRRARNEPSGASPRTGRRSAGTPAGWPGHDHLDVVGAGGPARVRYGGPGRWTSGSGGAGGNRILRAVAASAAWSWDRADAAPGRSRTRGWPFAEKARPGTCSVAGPTDREASRRRGPIDPAGAGIYSQYSHNSAGR